MFRFVFGGEGVRDVVEVEDVVEVGDVRLCLLNLPDCRQARLFRFKGLWMDVWRRKKIATATFFV
jgi:hypothetical protein